MIYGCIISVRLQAQVVVQLVLVVCQQVCAFDFSRYIFHVCFWVICESVLRIGLIAVWHQFLLLVLSIRM
jgi:hypothetical protein